MPNHITLIGDSIFDNETYVPGGPSVIAHLRGLLPGGDRASLIAVDGATTSNVFDQIDRIPEDTTHLVLSVGGNDALWTAGNVFSMASTHMRESLQQLGEVIVEFQTEYQRLIRELRQLRLPLVTCTVYDAVPGLDFAERAGLCVFNDVITRAAFANSLRLIDLRNVCHEPTDYSDVSPIEPSAAGGGKIARAIVGAVGSSGLGSSVIAHA